MTDPQSLTPRLVETLYTEALVLSDEVREAFGLTGRLERVTADGECARRAHSAEGLRTTTRMMHCIAWLLNLRAFLKGELSETQLLRDGRLPPDLPPPNADHQSAFKPQVLDLIARTQRFHERLQRLDAAWRASSQGSARTLEALCARIERQLSN